MISAIFSRRVAVASASRVARLRSNLATRCLAAGREFEHENDGAQDAYLQRPGAGGFARRNFVPDRLGHPIENDYTLHERIDKAGMSEVRIAYHRKTGKKVVVKTAEKSETEQVKAITRELEFLKVTDHPNIIRLYETFEDSNKLCMVLEYCDGGDLEDLIQSKHASETGFPEDELKHITREMLQSVAYCHAQSIVHRDIKPSNFMFKRHLKLLDFGVSGVVPYSDSSARLLVVQTGTDGYMAPEIIQKRPYTSAVDIFSLGVTLFYMIVGKLPFWMDAMGAYSFPESIHIRNLSADGLHFLSKLLARDPKSRPTASEALQHDWLSNRNTSSSFTHLDDAKVEKIHHHSRRSKLQRCARTSMVVHSSLHQPELVNLASEFIDISKPSDGKIQRKELKSSLRLRSSLEAADLLDSLDSSCSGSLGFSEWLVAASSASFFCDGQLAKRAFVTLDSDGDGLISTKDLLDVLPYVFTEEELAKEMKRYDKNGDGCIDLEEFCSLLQEEMS